SGWAVNIGCNCRAKLVIVASFRCWERRSIWASIGTVSYRHSGAVGSGRGGTTGVPSACVGSSPPVVGLVTEADSEAAVGGSWPDQSAPDTRVNWANVVAGSAIRWDISVSTTKRK